MTDTTTLQPGEIRQDETPEPENPAVASLKEYRDRAAPKHRKVKHVVYQGGAVGALGTVATVGHAFGPVGLAVTGVAVVAGAGVRAYSKRKGGAARRAPRGRTAAGRVRAAVTRTVSRRSLAPGRTAGALHGRRTGAYRRAHGGATGSLTRRTPRTAGIAQPRARAARRNAPRVTARPSTATRFRRRSTGRASAGSSGGVRHGRPHGGLTPTPSGAARRARLARGSRAGRPGTPATTPNRPRHARRASVRRQISRGVRNGIAIGKRYSRLTDPAHTPKMRAAAKKTTTPRHANTGKPAKPGKPVNPPTARKTAAKTAKKASAKYPKNTPRPSRPITAPGQNQKAAAMTATTPGVSAVIEAVRDHIAGFQPENAFDIVAFFSGLNELYTELGQSLTTLSQRMADEEPIDAAVTQHLDEIAHHTTNLGQWATQTERIFRQAHEVEIARIEAPRNNEAHWDVERNR